MSTAIDRLKSRPKARDSFTFALDPNDAVELDRLNLAAKQAADEAAAREKSPTAQKAANAARRAAEKFLASIVSVTITYEAIGAAAIEALRAEHPATTEQEEAERRNAIAHGMDPEQVAPEFDATTYLPALLAASTVRIEFSDDPDAALDGISEKDAKEFCADLPRGDQAGLIFGIELLSMRTSRVESMGKG